MVVRKALVIPLLMLGLPGCGGVRNLGRPDIPFPAQSVDRPFIVLHVTPAMPLPGKEMRYGLLAAVWPDGTIVRATSETAYGKSYIRGRIDPAQVAHLRAELGSSGLLGMGTDTPIVDDARAVFAVARWGATSRRWAYSPDHPQCVPFHPNAGPAIEAVQRQIFSMPVASAVPEPPKRWAEYPHELID